MTKPARVAYPFEVRLRFTYDCLPSASEAERAFNYLYAYARGSSFVRPRIGEIIEIGSWGMTVEDIRHIDGYPWMVLHCENRHVVGVYGEAAVKQYLTKRFGWISPAVTTNEDPVRFGFERRYQRCARPADPEGIFQAGRAAYKVGVDMAAALVSGPLRGWPVQAEAGTMKAIVTIHRIHEPDSSDVSFMVTAEELEAVEKAVLGARPFDELGRFKAMKAQVDAVMDSFYLPATPPRLT